MLEYSLSASLMVVLIAMLTGIADYVALLALFALDAAMIFFGWLMVGERIAIGSHSGIVRAIDPLLHERELGLVVQLRRDD